MSVRSVSRRIPAVRTAIRMAMIGLLISLAGAFAATAQSADPAPKEEPTLQRVEAKFVCMITDKHFDTKQIAVPVGDNTYYGCCEMCVQKLNANRDSRYAIDPVSGARVDKSQAVLGAGPDDTVYYFESVETLRAFDRSADEEDDAGR